MRILNLSTFFLALVLILASANVKSNPEGYTYAAKEDQSKTFSQPVDLAYGADGKYYYINDFVGTIRFDNETFGGDPIEGVVKAGYVKNHYSISSRNQSISDYQLVANENETMAFDKPVDLAYGAKDRYHHIDNFVGTITFDNKTFGGDPIEGENKMGYMKPHRNVIDNNHGNNQNNNQDINDYKFAANENETQTFRSPVDLAYGANGQYYYINDFVGTIRFDNKTFGGDPNEGVAKSGYVKYQNNPQQRNDISDYELAGKEGETMAFKNPVDLAYGAKGKYHFINDFTGTIRFDNEAFGGDPIEGVTKFGYVKQTSHNEQGAQNISEYKRVAAENESKTFHQPVDLAYGANGKYHFINDFTGTIRFDNKTFGGDPIKGSAKSGYMKQSQSSQNHSRNIDDYKFAANENESKTYRQPVDLAYGANGKYHFINDFTGTIRFDNESFGGDPSPGNKKQGYVRKIKMNRSNDRESDPIESILESILD